jgi:hypothetical protein
MRVLLPLDVPVDLGREEASRRAVEELAKAKYGGAPSWYEGLIQRLTRVADWVAELLEQVFGRTQTTGGVRWGVLVLVGVLVLALALVVWKVGLPRWQARRPSGLVELSSRTPADDYREQARAHAARGDYTLAVRDQFRAVVRELEIRTLLETRPARTAWEAAYSAVRVVPAAQPALFAGADLFNRVVYGEQVADAPAYGEMVEVDRAVTAAADGVDLAALEPVPAS